MGVTWICFDLLAIVNDAARSMSIQISLGDPALGSFEHISRSALAGSRGSSFGCLEEAPYCFPQLYGVLPFAKWFLHPRVLQQPCG